MNDITFSMSVLGSNIIGILYYYDTVDNLCDYTLSNITRESGNHKCHSYIGTLQLGVLMVLNYNLLLTLLLPYKHFKKHLYSCINRHIAMIYRMSIITADNTKRHLRIVQFFHRKKLSYNYLNVVHNLHVEGATL